MAVWVRLPGLPVEYFCEDVIKLILEQVGTPLKLDRTTTGVERGRFARAAVEIDLAKPLVSMVRVRKRIQRVEFEGLHVICFGCGEVGHRSSECPKSKAASPPHERTAEVEASPEQATQGDQAEAGREVINAGVGVGASRFGPWMMVQQRTKSKGVSNNRAPTAGRLDKGKKELGNRFSVLQSEASNGQASQQNGDHVQAVVPSDTHEGQPTREGRQEAAGKSADRLQLAEVDFNFSMQGLEGLHETPVRSAMGVGRQGKGGNKRRGKGGVQNTPGTSVRIGSTSVLPGAQVSDGFVFGQAGMSAGVSSSQHGVGMGGSCSDTPEESGS